MADTVPYNERELLTQTAEGNEAAFRKLFAHYKDIVYSAACRWLESADQAQDIVQEVFLALWKNRQAMAKVENAKVYILVATKNHVFNAFRKQVRSSLLLTEIRQAQPGPDRSVADWIDYKETMQLLRSAVAQLPPQQQKVFTLGKLEGFKLDEIAGNMGISLVTVNKHMALAVRSVKNYLAANDQRFSMVLFTLLIYVV